MRKLGLLICVSMVIAGCGGSEITMTEYASEVEELISAMNTRIDRLDVEMASKESTLDEAREFWESKVSARREMIAGFEAIEPPQDVAEMHNSALGIIGRLAAADEVVAQLIGSMASEDQLRSLLETAEYRATEAVDAEAIAMCEAAQAEFDSTADRAVFGDAPWIPAELREVVLVGFGCSKEDRQ